ncbi:hypothetical protein [Rhodococcus sp. NPDC058514]|uniref:hypothetical protein n=1 Tax=unclassified Rhodococcus (in: high G+C Gram-positive bacteria) TaxID=192944 RepID=UPI00364910EE
MNGRSMFDNPILRDPARIDPILTKLGELWHRNPDLRLTQLVVGLAESGETMPRFFNTEDDAIDASLDERLGGGG